MVWHGTVRTYVRTNIVMETPIFNSNLHNNVCMWVYSFGLVPVSSNDIVRNMLRHVPFLYVRTRRQLIYCIIWCVRYLRTYVHIYLYFFKHDSMIDCIALNFTIINTYVYHYQYCTVNAVYYFYYDIKLGTRWFLKFRFLFWKNCAKVIKFYFKGSNMYVRTYYVEKLIHILYT